MRPMQSFWQDGGQKNEGDRGVVALKGVSLGEEMRTKRLCKISSSREPKRLCKTASTHDLYICAPCPVRSDGGHDSADRDILSSFTGGNAKIRPSAPLPVTQAQQQWRHQQQGCNNQYVRLSGRVTKVDRSPAEIVIARRNSCSANGPRIMPITAGAVGKSKRRIR
jgi:hypothetical protein